MKGTGKGTGRELVREKEGCGGGENRESKGCKRSGGRRSKLEVRQTCKYTPQALP